MEKFQIKNIIEDNYNIKVNSLEKVKNTYKINGFEGYCLKVVKYDFPHFYFIYNVINHIVNNNGNVLKFIKTKSNEDYIRFSEGYAYLTPWIESRSANFNDLNEVKNISKEIAYLHKASEGFVIKPLMRPRVNWFSWINVFKTRKEEILDFEKRINQKISKDYFDNLYLDNIDRELYLADLSIDDLEKSKYKEIMSEDLMRLCVCHHDLADHNILLDKNQNVTFIDFDYCILDSYLHDLSSFLVRVLRANNWDENIAYEIINSYSEVNSINKDKLDVMKGFIRYPQGFWQLGLQAYWERQPWKSEKFNKRLEKYIIESKYREKFIQKFY